MDASTYLEGVVAEHSRLSQEMRDRMTSQGRVGASAVALVGGLVGILANVKLNDTSLIAVLVSGESQRQAGVTLAAVCLGFVIGIELLIAYWAYQMHIVFRLNEYLRQQAKQFRDAVTVPDHILLLSWAEYSHGGADLKRGSQKRLPQLSMNLVQFLQPASLFILGFLGIVGVATGSIIAADWLMGVLGSCGLLVLAGLAALMLKISEWAGGLEHVAPFGNQRGEKPGRSSPLESD